MAAADARAKVAKNAKPANVKINAISYNPVSGILDVYFEGSSFQTDTSGKELSRNYELDGESLRLRIKLYHRESLAADNDWTYVASTYADISAGTKTLIGIPLGGSPGFQDGFFKVEISQDW